MSTKLGGYMGRILKIDLSTGKCSEYPWTDEDRKMYLGGKITAAKILYDNIKHKIDPLSEENMLVITTGPLNGTACPSSSRFNISTISPLTGLAASSNCGGDFGIRLKKSGFDGLVICKKADKPVWIEINSEKVTIHDASSIWGCTTGKTQEMLPDNYGKIVIGPAGENLILYASIFSGNRAAGRAGVGAVMGSKNLKAVAAYGKMEIKIYDMAGLKKHTKKWVKKLRNHPITGKQLPTLGTAALLSKMNACGMLATKNFKYGRYEDFEKVSGEYLAEKYLIKNKGCTSCPIHCGRVVDLEGKQIKGPELETLGLLGPNIGNSDIEKIIKWNYELDELGMDTISTGGTIAFAMELSEKGMWDNGLKFGDCGNLSQTIEDIAYRRGIGNLLAQGSKRLAEKFGGAEFAMNSKGLELPAYEPRRAVGQGLGYAVANRGGCHINAGYLVILEGLSLSMDPLTTKSKPELCIIMQNLMEAISAGGNCIFSAYAVLPSVLLKKPNSLISRCVNKLLESSGPVINIINKTYKGALAFNYPFLPHTKAVQYVTGMKMSLGNFKKIGERGYNIERLLNIRLGLKAEDDSLPGRLTDECQAQGDERSKVPLEKLKKRYYMRRGWDKNGVPEKKLLTRLGLCGGEQIGKHTFFRHFKIDYKNASS